MVTVAEALDNAARLLQVAEGETNLVLMHQWNDLADTWTNIAQVLTEHDRA